MTDLLIIAPLPPQTSDAALMAGALERFAASELLDVTLVIDDLAPPPALALEGQTHVIRRRDLVAEQEMYSATPRLYVIGNGGDSLFALELFKQAPGAVLIANNSLFSLMQPLLELADDWPDAYWQWLQELIGNEHAEVLFGAKLRHRREAEAQAHVTPAFDLLLGKGAHVIAPSPHLTRQLTACGINPITTLSLALEGGLKSSDTNDTATTESPTPAREEVNIEIISDTEEIIDHLSATLKLYPATQMAKVSSIKRIAPDVAARIHDADIVILADAQHASACPLLTRALARGKAVITTGQRFAAHLPEGTHLSVPHAGATDSLAVAVAALISQPNLSRTVRTTGERFARASGRAVTGQELTTLAAQASSAPLVLGRPERQTPHTELANSDITREPLVTSQVALIGAPPPNRVLAQLFPSLDPALCPRFATPAVANRLAEIGNRDAASMLARTGFEAPLVRQAGIDVTPHRDTETWSDLAKGLTFGNKALSFACCVEGVPSADGLGRRDKASAQLPIHIAYDGKHDAPTSGYDSENGLFWDHDVIRNRLNCILMVGREAELALINSSREDAFMVADSATSTLLLPTERGKVRSDNLGILEFAIAGFDPRSGAVTSPDALRKSLAVQGLILEWSSHD